MIKSISDITLKMLIDDKKNLTGKTTKKTPKKTKNSTFESG